MTISLKHTTQATGTDAGNGEIRKAQWNEEHTLTLATNKLLGRATSGTGAVEELALGVGLSISGGTLNLNGPAFSVNKNGSNQTISDDVDTKVTWGTEAFDTNSNFASDKFTPTVAGYYLITARVFLSGTSLTAPVASIYKNGAIYQVGQYYNYSTTGSAEVTVSDIVQMNGSTDYLEVYAYGNVGSGSVTVEGAVGFANFSGIFLRGL